MNEKIKSPFLNQLKNYKESNKRCLKCKKSFKPEYEYEKYCSPKCSKKMRKILSKTPEAKARRKQLYQKPENKIKRQLYQQKKESIVRNKIIDLKKKFNLDYRDYLNMVEQQNNKCAICGNEETAKFQGGVKTLSVDHNHKTKQVRGLLCFRCNLMVGFANEDVKILKSCINYLKKWQKTLEITKIIPK